MTTPSPQAVPTYRLSQLAAMVAGRLAGPADPVITGIADLATAQEGQISFVTTEKYLADLAASKATAVLVRPDMRVERPAIEVERPDLAWAALLDVFAPPLPHPQPGVHPSAVVETQLDPSVAVGAHACIGPRTRIGANTVIHPNVTIGPDVQIGRDGVIWPGVVIRERVTIGDRVIIHPNAAIGADGFGYNLIDGRHRKIAHIGTVVIEDDVEIGACSCVDRAKAGATVIGHGTKIDNQVQIAHNVRIGPHSVLAAQSGIAGSSTLGRYVVLAGKAGISDHLTVGDGVRGTAGCSICKSLPPGAVVSGLMAYDHRQYLRHHALVRRLPELAEKVQELSNELYELRQAIHDRK